MPIAWPDERCILCLQPGALSNSHVIPRAVGGRMAAWFECAECNARLGQSFEAGLKSDPAVRLATEAMRTALPDLVHRMSARERFVTGTDGLAIYATSASSGFRVLDSPQEDGQLCTPPRELGRAY